MSTLATGLPDRHGRQLQQRKDDRRLTFIKDRFRLRLGQSRAEQNALKVLLCLLRSRHGERFTLITRMAQIQLYCLSSLKCYKKIRHADLMPQSFQTT